MRDFEHVRTYDVVERIQARAGARKRGERDVRTSERERFNEPATPEAIARSSVLVFRVMNAKLNNIRRRTFTLASRTVNHAAVQVA